MNTELFDTGTDDRPATDTVNKAGGTAYKLEAKEALARLAVTGIFQDTYYTSAREQLDNTLNLINQIDDPQFIAKLAVYSRYNGLMRDMPVVMTAWLSTTSETELFYKVFEKVINNVGQIRKFVQVIRSGVTGRRSLGSAPKKAIQTFLATTGPNRLFWQSVGSNPSLEDVVKLSHPRPETTTKDAFYAWLTSNPYEFKNLPSKIQDFEAFKAGDTQEVPDVPWNYLTDLDLSKDQWYQVFDRMTFNQLRRNLNTAARRGLFRSQEFTDKVVDTLRDPTRIRGSNILPFSLYTTIQYLDDGVPPEVQNAMVDVLEIALENTPTLEGKTLVLVDSSGSMGMNIGRGSTRYVDVAGLFASAFLKANPDAVVKPFDTRVHNVTLRASDSLATNTQKLARSGGGTNIGDSLASMLKGTSKYDNVIIISDNESWRDSSGYYYRSTTTKTQWNKYLRRKPNAKLVLWNISPDLTTQAPTTENTLNLAGYNDTVFDVVENFTKASGEDYWVRTIETQVDLD